MRIQRTISGKRVELRIEPDLEPLGHDLLAKLAELDARGPALRPGAIIGFGWANLRLDGSPDELEVQEPRFDIDALDQWRDGASDTLRVLREQIELCKRFGLEPVPSWYTSIALVEPGALEHDHVTLERQQGPGDGTSGWVIVAAKDDVPTPRAEDLQPVTIAKIWARQPDWMRVLALPPGHVAILNHGALGAIFDPGHRDLLDR
jgi:hypothetical protein